MLKKMTGTMVLMGVPLSVQTISYAHNHNRWVAYKQGVDSYQVGDPGLANFIAKIKFGPTFWVQGKDARIDYVLP